MLHTITPSALSRVAYDRAFDTPITIKNVNQKITHAGFEPWASGVGVLCANVEAFVAAVLTGM